MMKNPDVDGDHRKIRLNR